MKQDEKTPDKEKIIQQEGETYDGSSSSDEDA